MSQEAPLSTATTSMTRQNQNSKTAIPPDTDDDLMDLSMDEFNNILSSEFKFEMSPSFYKELGPIPRDVEQCAWNELVKMCDDEEPQIVFEANKIDDDEPIVVFVGTKTDNGEQETSEPTASTSANVGEDPKMKKRPTLIFRRKNRNGRRSTKTGEESVRLSNASVEEVPVPVINKFEGMPRLERFYVNDRRPGFTRNLSVLFGDRDTADQDEKKEKYRQKLRKRSSSLKET